MGWYKVGDKIYSDWSAVNDAQFGVPCYRQDWSCYSSFVISIHVSCSSNNTTASLIFSDAASSKAAKCSGAPMVGALFHRRHITCYITVTLEGHYWYGSSLWSPWYGLCLSGGSRWRRDPRRTPIANLNSTRRYLEEHLPSQTSWIMYNAPNLNSFSEMVVPLRCSEHCKSTWNQFV